MATVTITTTLTLPEGMTQADALQFATDAKGYGMAKLAGETRAQFVKRITGNYWKSAIQEGRRKAQEALISIPDDITHD